MVSEAMKWAYTLRGNDALKNIDIFSSLLTGYYTKHQDDKYKNDYRIVNVAARCGLGSELYSSYVAHGTQPGEQEKRELATIIQNKAMEGGQILSYEEAYRSVSFFCYMLKWEKQPPVEQMYPNPVSPVIPPKPPKPKKEKYAPMKFLIVHLLLSLLYIGVLAALLSAVKVSSSDPINMIGESLGAALAIRLVAPPLIISAIGLIFSVVGIFVKKGWPYLTSAIVDTVGLLSGVALFAAQPIVLLFAIPLVVMGYVTYAQVKKAPSNS